MTTDFVAASLRDRRPETICSRSSLATTLFQSCIFALFLAVTCLFAITLGQDANWDLQNYHFYDPWAWLHGRILDRDIAAAQLQTFHNPLLDVPFYSMVALDWSPRAIACVLALPAAIAALLLAKIAWRMFAYLGPFERAGATLAACSIGLTGAMGRAQLASTMNEWPGAMFTMAGLWLLVRSGSLATQQPISPIVLLSAGSLLGAASGLKLTAATYAVALVVALFLRRVTLAGNLREAALCSVGVAVGLAVTTGAWCRELWEHYRNPLFPYGNEWFHSPWWESSPVLARVFGPHDPWGYLLLPFTLFAPEPGFVAEMRYRDARFPTLYALALIALTAFAWIRLRGKYLEHVGPLPTTGPTWRFLAVFFVVAFAVWAELHAIARYLIPLEMLSGVLIIGLIGVLFRQRGRSFVVALAVVAIVAATLPADWGRIPFGQKWFDVQVPSVEPGALVLLANAAPMAYVLPFLPADAKHIGLHNNINGPDRNNGMQRAIADAIRSHPGPLYSLAFPPEKPARDLDLHGLHKVECSQIRTNMETSPLELCRLSR